MLAVPSVSFRNGSKVNLNVYQEKPSKKLFKKVRVLLL